VDALKNIQMKPLETVNSLTLVPRGECFGTCACEAPGKIKRAGGLVKVAVSSSTRK